MTPSALPKALFEEAIKLGVGEIVLSFSGGNDEGYLDVRIDVDNDEFEKKIENWAWDAYDYNGAGDGSDYGDDIYYNIKEKTVYTEEWFYERTTQEGENIELEIEEAEEEQE